MKVKVRIAPSPSGPLHVGTARSALFNFIFARKHDGIFILRIEDTDVARTDKIYENEIREGLAWLGLNCDEFYRESDRFELYQNHLKKLLDAGIIFWCSHSKDDLAREREAQMKNREAPRHICFFRDGNPQVDGGKAILRFKNNRSDVIEFDDIIRGKISFNPAILGDFSVARSLESPLYNFAVVIDDALMEITHVIRGEDLISSTPKQILLFKALNFAIPEYAHIPLILNTDRSKLSKRKNPTSISQYRQEGYLPEAMVNFLALLGWHPPSKIRNPTFESRASGRGKSEIRNEDIFSMSELIMNFDLKDVQKGGAIFDAEKLNWINGEYIRKKTISDLSGGLAEFLKPEWRNDIKNDGGKWEKIVALEQPRLTRLGDINSRVDYFFEEPFILKEELGWKNQKEGEIRANLMQLMEILKPIPENDFNKENLEKTISSLTQKLGAGEVLWPMRYALSGKRASPGPFEIAEVLGKNKALARISRAVELLAQ
ncbi:MAG: glutamate--tRNA ligase [Patescibacteria group bacterium]|mgnify:CR=1 FL=1